MAIDYKQFEQQFKSTRLPWGQINSDDEKTIIKLAADPANFRTYEDYVKAYKLMPDPGGRSPEYNQLMQQYGLATAGQNGQYVQKAPAVDFRSYTTAQNSGGGMSKDDKSAMKEIQQNYQNLIGGGVMAGGQLSPTADVYTDGTQTDEFGKPRKNAFISIIDPKTGLLRPEYQLGNKLDRSGIDAVTKEALRTGPSAWANLQKGMQKDELMKNSGAQAAQARSQLAMQGGLNAGSSERLASEAMKSNLLGGQNISRNIAIQDETNRMGMLAQLPEQQLAAANYDNSITKYNTGNSLNEILQKRAYDSNAYGEAMKAWGAEKTASASGGGGGGKK